MNSLVLNVQSLYFIPQRYTKLISQVTFSNIFAQFFKFHFSTNSHHFYQQTSIITQFFLPKLCHVKLKALKNSFSYGSGIISTYFLRYCIENVYQLLTNLSNSSLKLANSYITPLHKTCSRSSSENYRGIAKISAKLMKQ